MVTVPSRWVQERATDDMTKLYRETNRNHILFLLMTRPTCLYSGVPTQPLDNNPRLFI